MKGPKSAAEWPDKSFSKELQAMFEAISELNLWDKVAQGPSDDKRTGFMFSQDNWVNSYLQSS